MEVVAEPYVNWHSRDAEATEEEDMVEQLVERKSKHRIATSFDSDVTESEEVSETEDRKLEVTTSFDKAEIDNDLKHEELADEGLSGNNVFFDKASGTGFSNGTSEVQSRSTTLSVSEDGSTIQTSEVTEDSVTTTIQGSRTTITTQHKTIKDFETETVYPSSQSVQANGSQHPSLNSTINGNGHVLFSNQNDQEYHIKKDSTEELGDLLEGDPEPIDYDVEGVLKKQETHNLICPNCHSCITRRVILKKRKRVIKDVPDPIGCIIKKARDPEIKSPQEILQATVDENSANNVDTATDGQSQNDVITCWSCFSLLIPSGRGFKLFKVFGGRKQPEVTSAANPNQRPLLTSDNGGMPVDQGNTVNTVQLGNGNTVDQRSNITKKGGDYKLFWSYGNSKDENVNSSHQISTSKTSQFTTSSEETTNAHGTTLSNHVEVNTTIKQTNGVEDSKQTNSLPLSSNGLSSVGTGYLATTTHTELGVKGQKTEAGSNSQNVSSTVLYSHDEYQIKVHDRPDFDFESLKDGEPLNDDIVSALQGSTLLDNLLTDLEKVSNGTTSNSKDDVRISIENGIKQDISSGTQDVTRDVVIPGTETQAHGRPLLVQVREAQDWDILKSIVYGGLIESITSLGVVSSAAGAETATLNVLALGLANLIGGLILIFHNLKDLKKSAIEGPSNQVDRYHETLGQRNKITLHAIVVVLSFIIFGLIPIVTYAFTFRTSDNRDYKSLAVIGASLICITLLSIGKARTKNPPRTAGSYFISVTYYLSLAIAASGLSYIAGKLLKEFIEKTGWFDTTSSLNSIFSNTVMPSRPSWGSY